MIAARQSPSISALHQRFRLGWSAIRCFSNSFTSACEVDDKNPLFARIILTPTHRTIKTESITQFQKVHDMLKLRESYRMPTLVSDTPPPSIAALSTTSSRYKIVSRAGVLFAEGDPLLEEGNAKAPTAHDFHRDVNLLWNTCECVQPRAHCDTKTHTHRHTHKPLTY